MQVGDKVWIFDGNRRSYEDDKGNKLSSCWYRYHFQEMYILGETKQSWLVGYKGWSPEDRNNIKVNKKTLEYKAEYGKDGVLYISEEQVERKIWLNDNGFKIRDKAYNCKDYDKLIKIAEILEMKF
jgi:hypothetical protein